jgi:GMP synthase-like glutamine amidotransferase
MTRTLLINCYLNTTKITNLQTVLNKYTNCKVVSFEDIQSGYPLEGFEAVVISGSEARIVEASDRAKYEGVLRLIETCNVPILAICFGHQLLCSAFSAKTGTLAQPVIDRFEQVNVVQTGEIFSRFKGEQKIPLSEYHNDYVLKESLESAGFMLLADSPSCEVEAVKHITNLFYGVQFHPERIIIQNETHPEGHKVIENFFVHVVKRFG